MGRGDAESGVSEVLVRNVGGIETGRVSLSPGVTVLTGDNASNKTSLLTAIASALGGSTARLKSDADAGRVELTLDGERFERTFERRGGSVATGGDPYTQRTEVVDNFVCLVESNPVRRAVRDGEDLRDRIMAPVDEDWIRREIRSLSTERTSIEEEIRIATSHAEELPALRRRRNELESELTAVKEELRDLREAETEFDLGGSAEEASSRLEAKQTELGRVTDRIERQRASIEALEEERSEIESELAGMSTDEDRLDEVEAELDRAKRRSRELEELVSSLGRLISFAENVLEAEWVDEFVVEDDVVAGLDPSSQTVECFACGSTVERSAIDEQVSELKATMETKRERHEAVTERIQSLRQERSALAETIETVRQLNRRREEIAEDLDRRERRLSELRETAAELRSEIADCKADLADSQDAPDELVERQDRIGQLEYERGRLERDVEDVDERIDEAEQRANALEALREERDEIARRLAELRTRVDDREAEAVDRFNDQMATLVEELGYRNLDRVWIERIREDHDERSTFELHVVRQDDDGRVYEDDVETLSESEREVVGLAVALAGYLAHDVADRVPMVLLDSLEAVDADRLAALTDHFADHVDYVVVAALPEDAEELDADHRITPPAPAS